MSDRKHYTISKEDWGKLTKASQQARTTPVIAMSSQAALSGNDLASRAYKSVTELWVELGNKYGFNGKDVIPVNEKKCIIAAYPKEISHE